MRARLVVATAGIAAICAGCATGRGLRVQAERGAPIFAEQVTRRLEPSVGLMLVNPLGCLGGASGCGGGSAGDLLCVAIIVGCVGVLSAVDLVALPVQAARRHGQSQDLEAIELACPLEDPALRAAPALAARMVEEFGFSAVRQDTPADGASGLPVAPDAVRVRVRTTSFERSKSVAWDGAIEFLGPGGEVLWHRRCQGKAPPRPAEVFAAECAAAREELTALADRCVESVARDLRERWPGWGSARAAAQGPPEPAPPDQVTGGP